MSALTGLDIVRGVYRRLRKPSQAALPWQDVINIVRGVVARMLLDLALSPQNSTATTSDWFTPSATDFPMSDLGFASMLLPIRVERRELGSDFETGLETPMVNYEVLDTSTVGAISFYGNPIRMVFRDNLDTVTNTEYRIVYEDDFLNTLNLNSVVGLPAYFESKAILEAAYEACEVVDDDSAAWMKFVEMYRPGWEMQIGANDKQWDKYVRMFKGKAQVPKRTFWDNKRNFRRAKLFRG
jgi:hypothetical protein